MLNKNRAKILLEKYKKGECTPEEKRLIEEWYHQMMEEIEDPELPKNFEEKSSEVLLQIKKQTQKTGLLKKLNYSLAAACIALAIAGGYFFLNRDKKETISTPQIAQVVAKDSSIITQTTLKLSGGQVIVLDSNQSGIVIDMTSLSYADGSKIAEQSDNDPQGINYISTPRGKQFEVILPDSSKVWLNASSSLSYSNEFKKGDRKITLTGEAYFEVAHDPSRPFKVSSTYQVVNVLGTHFNIKSYEEEGVSKTTLLEGSVQIESFNGGTIKLKPNEESTLSNGAEKFQLKKVKASEAIAWRSGYFSFDKASLTSVLSEFSRWYDLEIINEIKNDNFEFVGKIDRSISLQKALKILEIHGVNFQLKNKVLTISEKHNQTK